MGSDYPLFVFTQSTHTTHCFPKGSVFAAFAQSTEFCHKAKLCPLVRIVRLQIHIIIKVFGESVGVLLLWPLLG